MKICDVLDCERTARSARAALCNMHYQRQYKTGTTETQLSAITLPAEPLIAYTRASGLAPEALGQAAEQVNLTLVTIDRLACNVLEVHPMTIYGNAWLTAA